MFRMIVTMVVRMTMRISMRILMRMTRGMGMTVTYLKETDEERRVSILHREREQEEQRTNLVGGHILDQGDRESLVEEEEEAKKKGSGLAQERGFFGSSPGTSTNLSLNLFLILILGLWTV